jgi:GTPase SAR1 family protein
VGDPGVGKASFISRFLDGTFHEDRQRSGLRGDFQVGNVMFRRTVVRLLLKILIYIPGLPPGDAMGRTLTPSMLRGSNGVFLAFDVTNRESFENVTGPPTLTVIGWADQVVRLVPENVSKVLVGLRSDLAAAKRQVSYAEATAYAASLGWLYIECNAKTGKNVELAVYAQVRQIWKRQNMHIRQGRGFGSPPVVQQTPTERKCSLM